MFKDFLNVLESLSVYFQHPYIFHPHERSIEDTFSLVDCSLVVVGEGSDGVVFSALMNMFDESSEVDALKSDRCVP